MLLKSLKLKDFRQFKGEQSVVFSTDPEKNVTIIMGENGSGKTTLLRALRGVEHIDAGKITVGDVSIDSDSSQFYYNNLKRNSYSSSKVIRSMARYRT